MELVWTHIGKCQHCQKSTKACLLALST